MSTRRAHDFARSTALDAPPSAAVVPRIAPDNDASRERAPESHIRGTLANPAERSVARAALGARFARNGEMTAQLLHLEGTMDALAERSGVAPVVHYVHKFTEAARTVEHALSLALRTALGLVTKHGEHPPESLLPCVDAVHGWFFDLAEHIAELMELQDSSRGAWGIPGRFLPEYSSSYVSCKIEPAIEAVLIECEELVGRREIRTTLISAIERLCVGVITLNEGLRVRL